MLNRLDIQNVILIDRLSLDADAGLVALTGETGAGKSILLDALGLALGGRAESGLVRHGAEQALVAASFDLPAKHPARALLREKDIACDDTLILRRTVSRDGRSKAFINDAPVSIQFLKEIGTTLVEVHGQFETQGLLDPSTHIDTLDGYAALGKQADEVKSLYGGWRIAREKLDAAEGDIAALKLQEEYLKYAVAELEKLDPQPGEEEILGEKRRRLMTLEKMSGAFDQATGLIEGEDGLRDLFGRLQTIFAKLDAPFSEGLSRAQAEIDELSYQLEKLKSPSTDDGDRLEDVEERYFALRECAKKHRCATEDLPAIFEDLSQKLRLITHQEDTLAEMRLAVSSARKKYHEQADKLSAARRKSAVKLAKAVNAELPDLKLDKATVAVDVAPAADEKDWGPKGIDRVQFMVSTNPGTPAGPLHKIASGGELSRFMLALKAILAETGSVPTLIFDEVDSGIGGATADAVGERLQRLSAAYQVLVVTHSPQVAARAGHHWHVAKSVVKGQTITQIAPLSTKDARQEEIARMLSGAEITKEARAQAARLLKNHDAAA